MPFDFVLLLVLAFLLRARGMPVDFDEKVKFENAPEVEKNLVDYLDWYYDTYVVAGTANEVQENGVENEDIYEKMQSDQAPPADFGQLNNPLYVNLSSIVNLTENPSDVEYIRTMRNRRDNKTEDRNKEAWINVLRHNILRHVGRMNNSTSKPPNGLDMTDLNLSQIMPGIQPPQDDDEFVTEKIRSYYPSCELPKNTDQDMWKDEDTMNLYFNVEQPDSNSNVATATLRLYRVPVGNVTSTSSDSCENNTGSEEQLMRISIYWYTKSLKRQRVKRRLSDSKVIAQSAKWVELSVLPATTAWMNGKNLGLAILVEDQEGAVLKADKYFKGASCMVGTSTPKPIPTVIVDAARWANELERIKGSPGRNTTTAFYNHLSLLPTVDICTLEFPQNSTHATVANYNKNGCDLSRMRQKLANTDASSALPTSRHIRHQKHNMDPRSRMVRQRVVLTSEEMRNLNAHLANSTYPSIQR